MLGWTVDHRLPPEKKFVVIGAPHTSNWDLPIGLLGMWALDANFHWVAKHTIFFGPAGWFFSWLGGIPVDRRVHTGFIHKAAKVFETKDEIALTIAPEGTRSKTEYWKSGFYRIAVEAKVPIALGYIDYATRKLGVGATLYPSGDLDRDFEQLKTFYQGKVGRNPDQQGAIRLKPG